MFSKILRAIGMYIIGQMVFGLLIVIVVVSVLIAGIEPSAAKEPVAIVHAIWSFILFFYCIFSLFDKREFK